MLMLSEQWHDLSVGCLAACCFPVNSSPRLSPQFDERWTNGGELTRFDCIDCFEIDS